MAVPFNSGRPTAAVATALGLASNELVLWPERIRVPEALFSPWILGASHVGLAEAALRVLRRLPPAAARAAARTVFLTGGLAGLPYLAVRVGNELRSSAPLSSGNSSDGSSEGAAVAAAAAAGNISDMVVVRARDPSLDAWRGAREAAWRGFTQDRAAFEASWCLTRAEWLAAPVHTIKENPLGNVFVEVVSGLSMGSSAAMADD
jgi:actin-related protein